MADDEEADRVCPRGIGRAMKLILIAALVAAPGCGGLVVFVEEDGGQGGNGEGGKPSTPTLGTPCEKLCFGTPSCETKPGCLENCQSNYGQGCDAAADAFFQCQFDTFDPVVCAPEICSQQLNALHDCQDG
jgi:hypothetical protein